MCVATYSYNIRKTAGFCRKQFGLMLWVSFIISKYSQNLRPVCASNYSGHARDLIRSITRPNQSSLVNWNPLSNLTRIIPPPFVGEGLTTPHLKYPSDLIWLAPDGIFWLVHSVEQARFAIGKQLALRVTWCPPCTKVDQLLGEMENSNYVLWIMKFNIDNLSLLPEMKGAEDLRLPRAPYQSDGY